MTPRSSGTTSWSHLPWKPPAPNSQGVRRPGPSDASCRPRSAQPRPPAAPVPPGSALRREGEHPRPHLVLRDPGAPSLPAHLPQDPTSPPPRSHSRRVHNEFPPTPALPPSRGPAGESRSLQGRAAADTPGGGEKEGEPVRHSKLTRTQPANFWAAARNARRPERSRSAEPSRRGCPGCNPPRGVAGGPASPAAPVHLSTCPAPGAEPDPTPPPTDASAFSSPGQSRDPPLSRRGLGAARLAPAIPLGVPPPLAAHPPAPFTSGKPPFERSPGAAWRAASAPAVRAEDEGRCLGVVGGRRGERRAGHSADLSAESRNCSRGSSSLACQLQLCFKWLPVSSPGPARLRGGRSFGAERGWGGVRGPGDQ